jgi:hypothetical protein
MTASPVARLRNQKGISTAEYAVVTAAGCGFGGILIKLLTSDWGEALLKTIFDVFLGMIGLK